MSCALQVMEKSNSCRGRDPGKHERLKLASHSTSGGFVLVNLFPSHTQTHTHSRTLPPSIVVFHVSMAPLIGLRESLWADPAFGL